MTEHAISIADFVAYLKKHDNGSAVIELVRSPEGKLTAVAALACDDEQQAALAVSILSNVVSVGLNKLLDQMRAHAQYESQANEVPRSSTVH